MKKLPLLYRLLFLITFIASSVGWAQDAQTLSAGSATNLEQVAASLQNNMNSLWTLIAASMVFFMQAGFAMVESGFTRAKNTVNIMMKNLMDFSIGTLSFFLVGFGLMFGASNGLFGTTHFAMAGSDIMGKDWNWTFLIFQTVFAGTAATIVSGAMAERTKFTTYLIFSLFICTFIYPIFGSWAWGSLLDGHGWLEGLGFNDFAGSTVVHSVGGWLALAGAIILGPRIGKFDADGKPKAIPGHNITLAALGVFILWFGWFGFNPGSTTFADGNIGRIAVTTNLSSAAAAITAMFTSWMIYKKPDGSMALNGASVSPMGAIWIGSAAGVLVVLSVIFIEHTLKIDDPVGAVSVHGVSGAFGTLAVGFFAVDGGLFYGGGFSLLGVQLIGVMAAFVWAFGLGLLLFWGLKKTMGLRVTEAEELRGLDIGEHGMEGYSGFQIFTTQ